ncbi:hypothetical protein PFISCL1PPCAC_19164 [Pristionchus fissidentatus]|uniref:F-box domain-containing protein n=1 Tax=Pristionchus fissidentatus TaxID=1538716 RepID=A0AAV5WD13_9BILA|nr:hypothetical protein PFISCL1PPCAC_19164 [Pristionchus fissidentatus]
MGEKQGENFQLDLLDFPNEIIAQIIRHIDFLTRFEKMGCNKRLDALLWTGKADYMNILVGNGNITVSFDDIHCKNMRIGKETIDKFGILANSMTFDRVKAKFMDKHVFESGIIDGIGALRVSFDYNHKLSEDLLRKVMRNKEKLELPRKIPAANLRRIHDNFAEFSRLFG